MWPDDPQRIALQVIGVVTGSVSILYFVTNSNLGLSPFTTGVVGLFLAVAFAITSLRHAETLDAISLYVLAGVAFLAGSLTIVTAYDLRDLGTLLALVCLTLITFALTRYRDGLPTPPRRAARGVVVAVVVLSLAITGADLATGDVQHSIETVEEVQLPENAPDRHERDRRIGTLTYTNPSPVPKEAGYPDVQACVRGVNVTDRGHGVYVRVDRDSNSLIGPAASARAPIVGHLERERFNATTFRVVRTERCPSSAPEPTIAVYAPPRPR